MARDGTVQGLAEANALFGALPEAAREQIGVEMAIIGRDVLAAQKRDVDKDTGALEGGLSLELSLERLRVRVGLLGLRRGRSRLFYGIIVEKGRKAQTVLVQRRRRVNGKLRLRGRRKAAEDIATTYSLKVKARAARPFVQVDRPELRAEERLADFWSETIKRTGAA